jgi:molybdopterin molybdotransferase
LRVGALCTGDELAPPGRPLPPGKIYGSNDVLLAGLLQGLGCELSGVETVADDLEATAAALDRLARDADVVITSGGVSVGEEDHVKAALARCGAVEWWKVAIKPGKPFVFGQAGGTPVLGLPGNPTSLFVTFCILVRPFLLRMQGVDAVSPPALPLPAHFARAAGGRREYLRVRVEEVDGRTGLVLAGAQGSGTLSPAARAHGLAVLPEYRAIQAGDPLDYLSFDHLLN